MAKQRAEEPATITYRGPSSASARPRPDLLGAVVRVVDAPATPASYRLRAGHCRIGAAPTSDIVIEAPTVSRNHAELSLVHDGVVVQDLGSHNGTFYLGQRIERLVVSLGARIRLGGVTVALDADGGTFDDLVPYPHDSYHGVVGASEPMRRLFSVLARLEGSLATVLLEGESGVGKDAVARAIHAASSVSNGPVVSLNCGALPRELVASELFGHRKGAFTGAFETRKGAFESADGGTLFLDEIGELPLDVQPMLLRVLETGEVRPVGGDAARTVRVRVIAATNRDLEAKCREGTFREDLFYRLAVVRLPIAPLRERVEDIEPLARLFACEARLDELAPDIVESMKTRAWPGNARELRNAVHGYAALGVLPAPTRSKDATLDFALRELVDTKDAYAKQKDALVDRFTALYVAELLASTGGNQSAAARIADMNRGYFCQLVAKYGLGKRE